MIFKRKRPVIRALTEKIIGSLDVGTATCNVARNSEKPGWLFRIEFEYLQDNLELKILDGKVSLYKFNGDRVLFTDIFNQDEQRELELRLYNYKEKAKETFYYNIENRVAFGIKKPRW